jgi:hypothetical protein
MWIEDADPNEYKTVVTNQDITLTGLFDSPLPAPQSIGGFAVPINEAIVESDMLTPSIMLSVLILPLAIALIFVKYRKPNQ